MLATSLLWVLGACGQSAGTADIEASVSEVVSTVVTVSWSTERDASARVVFGPGESRTLQTPWTEVGRSHTMPLYGLPAATDVSFVVETDDGDVSEVQWVTTGELPAGLPDLTVRGDAPALEGRYLVIGVGGSAFATLILDGKGRIVWYWEQPRTAARSRLTQDGRMVMSMSGPEQEEPGTLYTVTLDGEDLGAADTPHVHHDFVERPDGTLASIYSTEVEGEGKADGIVEIHPDGSTEVIWDAWEYWGSPEEAGVALDTGSPDWTHANAILHDPVDDLYLLSLRAMGSVLAIERNGDVRWSLFGPTSDFELVGDSPDVIDHHGMQLLDDGSLSLFDNGVLDGRGYSRVATYALDTDALTAEEAWSYTRDPPVECYVLGDVLRFAGGETLIVWSTAGELELLDAEDTPIWTVNTDLGYLLTYASVVDSLYPLENQ